MIFKKSELPNGIRVVTEFHPTNRAVSMGIWIEQGTRDESSEEAGLSHMIEHLVFKGTKTKSAYQIAKSLESLGGDLNAYTTKEYTCYHAHVLKEHWTQSLDVLSDLISHMKISQAEFELEKSVILQEIQMSDDQHEDLIFDRYYEEALKHPLGRPILGTKESISQMKLGSVRKAYESLYCGRRIIVSAAGNIDHGDFVAMVEKLLGSKKAGKPPVRKAKPKHQPVFCAVEKPIEQLHLLLGLPCSSFKDSFRFEAFIVNALLGGGMTSKLYQKIREKRGLTYSIYSSLHTYIDFGLIHVSASCEPKNMKKVVQLICSEFDRLKKSSVKTSDLEMFKTQVTGNLLLGADDLENRMSSIAINEMVFGKYKSPDEIINQISKVSRQSIGFFIEKYFDLKKMGIFLMGAQATEFNLKELIHGQKR